MKMLQLLTTTVLMCLATLSIKAQCSVTFSSSSTPANPSVVSFTSTVSGFQANFTSYAWTFYDLNGGILGNSYTANPTYTYNASGAYVVCVTVTDSICTNTYCDSVLVSGGTGNPCNGVSSSFALTTSSANAAYLQASLSGSPYTNDPYEYTWTIDGMTYRGKSIYFQAAAGAYVACLSVTDTLGGCTIATYCDSIIVQGNSNPCNGISSSFTSTASGSNVTYLQASLSGSPYTNDPYEYTWTIDGMTYRGKSIYFQAAAGAYVACLSVTDTLGGCTIATYCDSIIVGNSSNPCNGVSSSFALTTSSANAAYLQASLSGSPYTNDPYEYTWTIDGMTYRGKSIYFQAAAGAYVACLSVTDTLGGCTIATYCDSIIVGNSSNPCNGVSSSFALTTSSANAAYLQASLSGSPYTNDPYEYTWTIDGMTYRGKSIYFQAAAGAYIACLSVTDTLGGCTIATYCDSIIVTGSSNPCANFTTDFSFTRNPMLNTTGQFTATVTGGTAPYSYVWTVGNNTVTTSNPTWQFPGNGAYSVCLAVYDANGCIATKCDSVLISNTGSGNNPCAGLSASFTYTNDSSGTNSGYFSSTVTGGTAPYTYSWAINNSTATSANPYWQFNGAGTYNICLTVTDNNGCATTTCNTIVVGRGNPCGNITVSYTVSQNTNNPFVLYLQPVITGLNMNPANSGLDFIWTWGDNTGTVGGAMPSHQYSNTGAYVVCLTAIDTVQGCAYTFCDSIAMDSLGNFSRNAGGFIINTVAAQYNTVTSVAEQEKSQTATMLLFPNPVQNTLNLSLDNVVEEDAQLAIFDLNGQQVINKVVNLTEGAQQLSLPVTELSAGVYIVRLQGAQVQHSDKFIKQ